MEAKKIFVLGSKQTLRTSAVVAGLTARCGFNTTLKYDNEATCHQALDIINSDLDIRITTGEVKEAKTAILNRLNTTANIKSAEDCDVAIESVFEKEEVKHQSLSELSQVCPPKAIIATNTSTITVTRMARAVKRPDNLIGMHFIHFGPALKVAEIVRGVLTSENTFSAADSLSKSLGLEVVYPKDTPGFLTSRSWLVYINETANCVYTCMGTAQNFVELFKTMGARGALSPLESADYIGIDNCVVMLENLYRAYGDQKFCPCPLLLKLADAGHLGRSTGKGFFTY